MLLVHSQTSTLEYSIKAILSLMPFELILVPGCGRSPDLACNPPTVTQAAASLGGYSLRGVHELTQCHAYIHARQVVNRRVIPRFTQSHQNPGDVLLWEVSC